MDPKRLAPVGAFLLATFFLTGCVSWMSNPAAPDAIAPVDGLQSFNVMRGAYLFGGRDGVVAAMRERFPRAREIEEYDAPATGTFVRVRTRDHEMSLAGKIYGYVALSFLTIIPFYNGETGCDVIFEVFRNGQMLRSYAYPINRHMFVWLGALPVSWISAFTPSERNAAHAAASRFFEDVTRDGLLRP